MAAARSLVGPNLGSLARHAAFTQGSKTFLGHTNLSSMVVFGRGLVLGSDNVLEH